MTDQLQFEAFADREAEVLTQIGNLLLGKGPWPLTPEQKTLLYAMEFHIGRAKAVQLARLCELTRLKDREVKNLMRSLVVDFKVRIGAARTEPYGYYLIVTADEAKEAAQVYESEIIELAKRVRVLRGREFVAELLGQIRMKLDEEKAS